MLGGLRSKSFLGIVLASMICVSAQSANKSVLQFETRGGLIYLAGEAVPFSGLNEDFYPSGKLWFRITIKDGVPDGKAEFWYENGNKKSEQFYAKGTIVGIQREWSEDGDLAEEVDHGENEIE